MNTPLPEPVDLRGLLPPEPMERILEAIAQEPGQAPLRFLLSREPLLLYGILRGEGLRFRVLNGAAGVEILIERSAPPSP